MEPMDRVRPEIERLFQEKEARRAKLAGLPFHEKVKVVVQMQHMAVPILRARGKQVRVWTLPETEA